MIYKILRADGTHSLSIYFAQLKAGSFRLAHCSKQKNKNCSQEFWKNISHRPLAKYSAHT